MCSIDEGRLPVLEDDMSVTERVTAIVVCAGLLVIAVGVPARGRAWAQARPGTIYARFPSADAPLQDRPVMVSAIRGGEVVKQQETVLPGSQELSDLPPGLYDVRVEGQTPLISLLLAGALTLPAPVASLQAQASPRSCALLTSAELEGALGGKVTATQPQEIPYKKDAHNDHDGVLFLCTYQMGARSVMVVYSTQPVTAAGRQRGDAQAAAATDHFRHQGWTIQSHDFGATKCWTGAAPAGTKSPFSPSTSCGAVRGSYFVSITVTSTNTQDRVPMEQAKHIADIATGRLP
jgi:hypothetical protein